MPFNNLTDILPRDTIDENRKKLEELIKTVQKKKQGIQKKVDSKAIDHRLAIDPNADPAEVSLNVMLSNVVEGAEKKDPNIVDISGFPGEPTKQDIMLSYNDPKLPPGPAPKDPYANPSSIPMGVAEAVVNTGKVINDAMTPDYGFPKDDLRGTIDKYAQTAPKWDYPVDDPMGYANKKVVVDGVEKSFYDIERERLGRELNPTELRHVSKFGTATPSTFQRYRENLPWWLAESVAPFFENDYATEFKKTLQPFAASAQQGLKDTYGLFVEDTPDAGADNTSKIIKDLMSTIQPRKGGMGMGIGSGGVTRGDLYNLLKKRALDESQLQKIMSSKKAYIKSQAKAAEIMSSALTRPQLNMKPFMMAADFLSGGKTNFASQVKEPEPYENRLAKAFVVQEQLAKERASLPKEEAAFRDKKYKELFDLWKANMQNNTDLMKIAILKKKQGDSGSMDIAVNRIKNSLLGYKDNKQYRTLENIARSMTDARAKQLGVDPSDPSAQVTITKVVQDVALESAKYSMSDFGDYKHTEPYVQKTIQKLKSMYWKE